MEGKKLQFLALVYNDTLKKSDAIICLEGDGISRAIYSARLFKDGWANFIVVSGGLNNPKTGAPAASLAKELIKKGVPSTAIIIEDKSQNTKEQAEEVMKLTREKKWSKIILVASAFHQPRAFLTFLKAMEDVKQEISIFNAPVRELSWFKKSPWGKTRFELLEEELRKTKEYTKKGDLASFDEAIEHQKWKEAQV